MARPFDKHIDNKELDALVPSSSETGRGLQSLPRDTVREAESHVGSCADCRARVSKYRQLMNRSFEIAVSKVALPGTDCPKDIDWHKVAAGLWPEFKVTQLIMHAALCDHCGPLLRAATSLDDDPTPHEEKVLAKLKKPSQPDPNASLVRPQPHWKFMKCLVPVLALMVIVGAWITIPSPTRLSGPKLAEIAVSAHRRYTQGNLALDLRSDSQQALNKWLKSKCPFSLDLPASAATPGEERPYRLEGARLVRVGGKTAAFIAYQLSTGPASLMVIPDSVAVASGGSEVDFSKVSFHYASVEGYKVVTWSVHGLTYALVSQEGNTTQRSCMICHSTMGDRDLSHTPTPLSR